MADDKTKRGSPDNKRLNKSEPYEMAHARKKAAGKTGKAAGKAAGKASAKAPAKAAAKAQAKAPAKAPAKSPAKKSANAQEKSAGKPAAKKAGGSAGGGQARSPRATARAQRAKGAEKTIANTAPTIKRMPDAVDLLTDDHLAVDALFKRYRKLMSAQAPAAERQSLANTICRMLTAHAQLEEDIFYPAARAAGVESDLMDEADIEHAAAKALIGQIEIGSPDADQYDAKVAVLGEYVEHHVLEEHSQIFTKCRRADMDLVGLRTQMEASKAQLLDPGLQPPVPGLEPGASTV